MVKYKILDIGYNKCYIGATVESLSQRMAKHRRNYKVYLKNGSGGHCTSFDIFNEFGIKNCKIELIEKYSCYSKAELSSREGYHIKNNDCVNKVVAGRKIAEYRHDKQDDIKAYVKKHYHENRDRELERNRIYKQNNKMKIAEYRRTHDCEPIICECGCQIRRAGIARHRKTKIHIDVMQNKISA